VSHQTHPTGKGLPVFLMHERDDTSGALQGKASQKSKRKDKQHALWEYRDGRAISARIDGRSL
jgi:hypothetical protein